MKYEFIIKFKMYFFIYLNFNIVLIIGVMFYDWRFSISIILLDI